MKKLWFFAALFLGAGIVMLLLPVHMQPTGAVLLLLGLAMGIPAAAVEKTLEEETDCH